MLNAYYCKREMRNSVKKNGEEDSSKKKGPKSFKAYLKNVAIFTFPIRCL